MGQILCEKVPFASLHGQIFYFGLAAQVRRYAGDNCMMFEEVIDTLQCQKKETHRHKAAGVYYVHIV